jgi:putative DNA primase/helicase
VKKTMTTIPPSTNVVPFTPTFSEDALALRFSARHEHDLRYVAAKGRWYEWDNTIWRPEETLHVYDLARASCRDDANAVSTGKAPQKLFTAKTVAAVT